MSSLIEMFLTLVFLSTTFALDGLGLSERINTLEDEPVRISPSHQCDFFSTKFKAFNEGPCYSKKDLDSNGSCNKTQICMDDSHCFMSWTNESGVVKIMKSGCWLRHEECEETPECRAYNNTDIGGVFFCCCLGDNCNRQFFLDPADETDIDEGPGPVDMVWNQWLLVPCILVPLFVVCVAIVLGFWCYRRKKQVDMEMDAMSVDTPATGATRCTTVSFPTSRETIPSPQFLDVKARGRFGKVWRAQLHDKIVAVKTFDLREKASWQNEQDIFCTPLMNTHPNVLKFLTASNRGEDMNSELWLITEFYDRGSLADYLKVHTVTFKEALNIMRTMASGLSFLHEDVQKPNQDYKPTIAHRDFKSKNVLLNHNSDAIIADFGLAVKFVPGESPGESHGQVGTLRYMAPEVLEGAITFQKDAFLRIDMYAFGLVVWEILTRCPAASECEDFRMPFEAELGTNPSMDCMQEFVVEKKLRPHIKIEWRRDRALSTLCETMEECWDHDAEARLSAGCVELRVAQIQRQKAAKEQTQLIVNTSPQQNNFGDTETMNQLNIRMNNINGEENNKNSMQNMHGPQTTTFTNNIDQGNRNNKVQEDTYVVFPDEDDRDSGTFANEDTLSHDGIMEKLMEEEISDENPNVEIVSGDISSGTSLLNSSEQESEV